MAGAGNHYEKAFENWLAENRVKYIAVDRRKKEAFSKTGIKSFDFLFFSPDLTAYAIRLRGRKFTGKSLAAFGSLQNWLTTDDIENMDKWLNLYNGKYQGLFVFAYELEKFNVDTDGRETFVFENKKYAFVAIKFDDYKKQATIRSRKWKTLHLKADSYKKYALNLNELLGLRVIL